MDHVIAHWLECLERDGFIDVELILNELFVHTDRDGRPCPCSCHPSPGAPDQHGDHGCACTHTAEQHRSLWAASCEETDIESARWEASEEGIAETARQAAEVAELDAWIAADPDVDIESWGGRFPEQWSGTIDGHSFYFRERHGHWSIEIDRESTGATYRQLVDDQDVPEDEQGMRTVEVPVQRGVTIADGPEHDLGPTPRHHGRFIVDTVRAHLRRESCPHPDARRYCPECGAAVGS